jgi:hypothetical protein
MRASGEHQRTAISCVVDEFCKTRPALAQWRRSPPAQPPFSEAEVLSLALWQGGLEGATLNQTYRLGAETGRAAFPTLPSYPPGLTRWPQRLPHVGELVAAPCGPRPSAARLFLLASKPHPLCQPLRPGRVRLWRDEGASLESLMVPREACPQCGSRLYKRHGHSHTGKQNHRWKLCGRAFVLPPENQVITEEQRTLIERLRLERVSVRGICRAVRVALRWLLPLMVERFQAAPAPLYVELPVSPRAVILQRLKAEVDELWSFVGTKANRQGVWSAMAATTRQVSAFHVGDRRGQSATALWERLPAVYQERATFSTEQ